MSILICLPLIDLMPDYKRPRKLKPWNALPSSEPMIRTNINIKAWVAKTINLKLRPNGCRSSMDKMMPYQSCRLVLLFLWGTIIVTENWLYRSRSTPEEDSPQEVAYNCTCALYLKYDGYNNAHVQVPIPVT